jgi:UDP-3-O-[3-hydroxymyristoyl] glucosamine N-acyltransferase
MTEPRFFKRPKGLSAGEIATLTGAEPAPGAKLDRRITNIAPLDHAGPSDLAFLDNPKYAAQLAASAAGVCLIAKRFAGEAPGHVTVLIAREPYRAFVTVAHALYPDTLRPSMLASGKAAAGAFVDPTARLEPGVAVDPGAAIGPRAEIGAGTSIGANVVIGADVRIGRNCTIGAGATLTHALVGDRVIVHPGARIGQDGFGYVPGPGGHLKVPQVGRVVIQDNVEIGANTTIDNLVQIGHNCTIGRHCIIVAHAGVSGSVTLGDYVMLGARVGLADHITIGEGAQIGAAAGVMNDVPAGARWVGTPAKPAREFFREVATLKRLARNPAAEPRKRDDAPEAGPAQ